MTTTTTTTATFEDALLDIIDRAELRDEPSLRTTQEMPVVQGYEIIAASTYSDEELSRRMWIDAMERATHHHVVPEFVADCRREDLRATSSDLQAIDVDLSEVVA